MARTKQRTPSRDPVVGQLHALGTELDALQRALSSGMPRADARRVRRVVSLMLAAADGASDPVLVVAILRMATTAVAGMGAMRQVAMETTD